MKYYFALLLILNTTLLFAQQAKKIASETSVYSEEGFLQMTIAYEPGCNCRSYTEYFYTGKISSKKRFKMEDDKEFIDGEDIIYYQNGNIKEYKFWKHSFPEGRAYSNYENGKLEHEEFYENKFKSGTWKYYDKNGKIIRELTFLKGQTPWDSKINNATEKVYEQQKTLVQKTGKNTGVIISTIKKDTILTARQLFQINCMGCHDLVSEKSAPALLGIGKVRKKEWLMNMIKDASYLVETGDKQAKDVYLRWNRQNHPSFKKLSNSEIESIINYLK